MSPTEARYLAVQQRLHDCMRELRLIHHDSILAFQEVREIMLERADLWRQMMAENHPLEFQAARPQGGSYAATPAPTARSATV